MSQEYGALREIIGRYGKVAVAFSGGVDSTLVTKAAFDVVGPDLLVLFADSELLAPSEAQGVGALARHIGCRVTTVRVDPLQNPEMVENPPTRCYLCKHFIYRSFLALSRAHGCAALLDGTNLDDLHADRPGLRAIRELQVQTPLVAAGLGKGEIRALSRELGLPTWNKPSASCLATRIPAYTPITRERLRVVGRGEEYLHGLGFAGCRLRLVGEGEAMVQLAVGGLIRFLESVSLAEVRREFAALGITKIGLDLEERPGIFL